MTTILEQFETDQIAKLTDGKTTPNFAPGDTVKVNVRIIEGSTERVQAFEGLCIARKNRGIHSSFIVRKISNGEGVERIFPLYSPRIDSIELVRRGVVRRAKLYYMRELRGKAARIKEKQDFQEMKEAKKAKSGKKAKKAKAASKVDDTATDTPKENNND